MTILGIISTHDLAHPDHMEVFGMVLEETLLTECWILALTIQDLEQKRMELTSQCLFPSRVVYIFGQDLVMT